MDTTNNATATATDALGGTVSDWDIATNLVISPKICIEKTVDCNGDRIFKDEDYGYAGDNATWKVVVKNCGTATSPMSPSPIATGITLVRPST